MALPLTEDEREILNLLRQSGAKTISEVATTLDMEVSITAMTMARLVRRGLVLTRNIYEATDLGLGENL